MAERLRDKRKEAEGSSVAPARVEDSGRAGSGEAEGSDSKRDGGEEGGPREADTSEEGEGADSSRGSADEGGE